MFLTKNKEQIMQRDFVQADKQQQTQILYRKKNRNNNENHIKIPRLL